jgi:flagellar biosynthesis component FlhA
LTERVLSNLVVLSFNEIAPGVEVQSEGMVVVE